MLLVMSGAILNGGLESEFGDIPPSFLPLGNKRLFKYQFELVSTNEKKFICIPKDFKIHKQDNLWFSENNISLISVNRSDTLISALLKCLEKIDMNDNLRVLFGDTLYDKLPNGCDLLTYSIAKDNFKWDELKDINGINYEEPRILDGYFSFSNKELLKECLNSSISFAQSIEKYINKCDFEYKQSNGWLDFGHITTYYKSRVKFTTERVFNDIAIDSKEVKKSSSNNHKIICEGEWFKQLPDQLKLYTPILLELNKENYYYKIEYLYLPSLSELYVFTMLPLYVWKKILTKCFEFLSDCSTYNNKIQANYNHKYFKEKTYKRLNIFIQNQNLDLNKNWNYNDEFQLSIKKLLNFSNLNLPNVTHNQQIIHGDFCFSNILFDYRSERVKVIDPRAIDIDDNFTLFGDVNYDIAKLAHSIVGNYDLIICDYYELDIKGQDIFFEINLDETKEFIKNEFLLMCEHQYGLTKLNIISMCIHLFLSMIPLHNDNLKKQYAFLANSFRLYNLVRQNT